MSKVPTHYEAKTEPGRSFILIDGTWTDVTDPDLRNKLGHTRFPETEGMTTIGDPCITLLFK